MNCDKCGNPVDSDAKFCRVCGAQLNVENVETPVQEEAINNDSIVSNEKMLIPNEEVIVSNETVDTPTFVEPVNEIENNNEVVTSEEVTDKKTNNNLVFVIMVVLMVIIIAGLVILLILNKQTIDKNNTTTTTTTTTTATTTTTTAIMNKVDINGMSIVVPDGYEAKPYNDMDGLYDPINNNNYYGFTIGTGNIDDVINNQETYKVNLIAKGYENPMFEKKTIKSGLSAVLDYYTYAGVTYGELFIQLDTDYVLSIYISNFNYEGFASVDANIDIMITNIIRNSNTTVNNVA